MLHNFYLAPSEILTSSQHHTLDGWMQHEPPHYSHQIDGQLPHRNDNPHHYSPHRDMHNPFTYSGYHSPIPQHERNDEVPGPCASHEPAPCESKGGNYFGGPESQGIGSFEGSHHKHYGEHGDHGGDHEVDAYGNEVKYHGHALVVGTHNQHVAPIEEHTNTPPWPTSYHQGAVIQNADPQHIGQLGKVYYWIEHIQKMLQWKLKIGPKTVFFFDPIYSST